MKLVLQFFLLFVITGACCSGTMAQSVAPNAFKQRISSLQKKPGYLNDTAYIAANNALAFMYSDNNPDSAIKILDGQAERCKAAGYKELEVDTYKILGSAFETKGSYERALECYTQAYQLAEKNGYKKALPGILNNIGLVYYDQGNYPEALKRYYETLQLAEALNNMFVTGSTLNNIGNVHFFQGKMSEAEADYRKMLTIAKETRDTASIILGYNNIAEVKLKQNNTAAALSNLDTAVLFARLENDPGMAASTIKTMGYVHLQTDSLAAALANFETAAKLAEGAGNVTLICDALKGLAATQQKKGLLQAALTSALKGLQLAQSIGHRQLIRDCSEIISSLYDATGDNANALKYYRFFKVYSDSVNNLTGERAAATYKADYEYSKKELEFQRKSLTQRWIIFSSFAALITLVVIVWLVNRNRSKLEHTYKDLQQKNLLIEAQKKEAEETLLQLKAAQVQLIQAEKMASLGELTAGIAHEIQNPLNFVNNFSELNVEMIAEMRQEIDNGNYEEVKSIASDIEANEIKISHHGKRADSIVKGMLQHSNARKGNKELTDLNNLVGEHLRLSYQSFKAKDSDLTVTVNTDFDDSIGGISIIPQEIGRVLLNILANAFYAVKERKAREGDDYGPAVSISTKKIDDTVQITISDNGNGIPQHIIGKIFQPFFTTKPTGQGTGLGLSLAYDIVKAHGGELKVETKESEARPDDLVGRGSTFIIKLSMSAT